MKPACTWGCARSHGCRAHASRGYGHPYGYAPLRDAIAAQAATLGMSADSVQVPLTQGVTHGLDVAIRTLLRPGDAVIVEQPCYANLLALLRLAGLHAVPVRRTVEGLDIAELGQAAQAHRPRAMIINTVLQNPTGTRLDHGQRLPGAAHRRTARLLDHRG